MLLCIVLQHSKKKQKKNFVIRLSNTLKIENKQFPVQFVTEW